MGSYENLTAAEKIQGALVECLKEKIKLDELTIAELSKRAGVGKSTFYRHYKDIYDVYEQLVDGFMERVEALIVRAFFEKNITVKEAMWILMKSGAKRDNELFYAKDAILINYSIEIENEDGTTLVGIWFKPLPDEVAHKISKKYQLYK